MGFCEQATEDIGHGWRVKLTTVFVESRVRRGIMSRRPLSGECNSYTTLACRTGVIFFLRFAGERKARGERGARVTRDGICMRETRQRA